MLWMNLLTSESRTIYKSKSYDLNDIVLKNIRSGTEISVLAVLISEYESLGLLTWCANCERDITCDLEENVSHGHNRLH